MKLPNQVWRVYCLLSIILQWIFLLLVQCCCLNNQFTPLKIINVVTPKNNCLNCFIFLQKISNSLSSFVSNRAIFQTSNFYGFKTLPQRSICVSDSFWLNAFPMAFAPSLPILLFNNLLCVIMISQQYGLMQVFQVMSLSLIAQLLTLHLPLLCSHNYLPNQVL